MKAVIIDTDGVALEGDLVIQDLAMAYLPAVRAPTLLIIGGLDGPVIDMNTSAAAALGCRHEVRIIPGATHLFPEPGKLETVARFAAEWFVEHLT